tara:strand:- start:1922 stop:2452 length:531 start_codon:yes stop_codon:yes gene_type:complete
MRKELNKLIENLERFSAIDDDAVGVALDNLYNKISEVEKRLVCVVKTNKDIQDGVHKIIETNDSITASDCILHDEVLRATYDVAIAVNLNDNEPIEENWYGLFDKQKSEIEKDKQRREIEKLVERLEMIENDSELTTKFRKIYATDFDIIKACIRENMVKKRAIKVIKQLTKDYEG